MRFAELEQGMLLQADRSKLRQEIQASVSRAQEANSKDLSDLKVELAMLKVRAGLWGAVGAAIPICITIAVALLVHFLTKKAGG